ncbi:FHA domain-containing protein [Roseateles violae]|uniref:FHA domain-containing protein n=1 Tax=Roseateles violae TaxID=3058042 RepID=A0ABT8DVJ0_9BURK|nr:FHA domain-containing protein [Pelomonas sp. PFR6]MDN3922285.1 FHA domain-containing protein [Pelomonas sp. PFR6]
MDGGPQDRAAVIEVLDRDGQARAVHKIRQWPARIGRSPGCELVLDDAHVAAEHAELSWSDEAEGPRLTLLPSLNGGWIGERRLAAGESVALGAAALFQLGATQLRWRSAAAPLAPELPLESHQLRRVVTRAGRLALPLLLLAWLALLAFEQWTSLNPGSRLIEYSSPVLGPLAAVLGWAAAWSLVTQLFRHRFPFASHLRRALVWLLAMQLLDSLLPLLAYAFSWGRLMVIGDLLFPVSMALLLWWHASLVWPRARRALATGLGLLLLLGLGLNAARRQEQQHWFGPPYLSALPPPALRLATPKPPQALLEQLRPLQAELARQAKKDNEEPDSDGQEE